MIKNAQRKKFKKVLKGRFSKDVLTSLKVKNIVNEEGKPFSVSFISHVFNGRYDNEDIETAILEVFQERKLELSKRNAKLDEALKK